MAGDAARRLFRGALGRRLHRAGLGSEPLRRPRPRFEEGAGIAFALAQGPRLELNLESGVSLVQERATTTTAGDNFSAGRAAARYLYHLNEAANLRQALELLANLEATRDVRLNSETALVAPLSAAWRSR